MKIVISAALGVLMLVASPATAQLYKPGTATATPRLAPDRPAATQRQKSVVQPFYKAGSTIFMLGQADRRQAKMPGGRTPARRCAAHLVMLLQA